LVTFPFAYVRPEENVVVAAAYTLPPASTPKPELVRPASVRTPAEEKEEVAVAPKYAPL
jgi:hypothetical protein